MKKILGLPLMLFMFSTGLFSYVVKPEKNMIAKKLFGKWTVNAELTKRLINRKRQIQVEFKKDNSVVEDIPRKYDKFLIKTQIYAAGWFIFKRRSKARKYPFIFINYHGAPFIVFFRPRNGEPMGDAESLHIMLAQAREKKNDILFIGGDFSGEPFIAFDRLE